SVARSRDRSLQTGPRRTQNRAAPLHESVRPHTRPRAETEDLTGLVLGIARGSSEDGADADPFLQTAVYSRQELAGSAAGAPGFSNTPDSDPALAANREWARRILERIGDPAS